MILPPARPPLPTTCAQEIAEDLQVVYTRLERESAVRGSDDGIAEKLVALTLSCRASFGRCFVFLWVLLVVTVRPPARHHDTPYVLPLLRRGRVRSRAVV